LSLNTAEVAYFTRAAIDLIQVGSLDGPSILCKLPSNADMVSGTSPWVLAVDILKQYETDSYQIRVLMCILAMKAVLLDASLTTSGASVAVEFIARSGILSRATLLTLLQIADNKWPGLHTQVIRLQRLACGSVEVVPVLPCMCASAHEQGCYHAMLGFGDVDFVPCLPYECCICYESIGLKGWAYLSCRHMFHKTCIKQWFGPPSWRTTCPVCRDTRKQYLFRDVESPFPQIPSQYPHASIEDETVSSIFEP